MAGESSSEKNVDIDELRKIVTEEDEVWYRNFISDTLQEPAAVASSSVMEEDSVFPSSAANLSDVTAERTRADVGKAVAGKFVATILANGGESILKAAAFARMFDASGTPGAALVVPMASYALFAARDSLTIGGAFFVLNVLANALHNVEKVDLEQAQYLVEHTFHDEPELRGYYTNEVIPILQTVLGNIPPLEKLARTGGLYAFRPEDIEAGIQRIYNKALYIPDHDRFETPLLNPDLNVDEIQQEWHGTNDADADNHHPGIVVIDDILSPTALTNIRKLLLESTVWYQTKMPLKFGGYVGAYIEDGLHEKILLEMAFELHKALPQIMQKHDLKYMWAYKYDSDYTGINIHADQAAVNVNLWITPQDANLDPTSGGLVIFTAKPPPGWDFAQFNTDTERVMEEILRPTNFANVTVPYRENRAVIFDSALFHRTDDFRFRDGYQNRRINLTILYGDMQLQQPTCEDDAAPGAQKC